MSQTSTDSSLMQLLNDISAQDYALRKRTASLLRQQYPAQALRPLHCLLGDPRADVRAHAVKELSALKHQATLASFELALNPLNTTSP